MCTDVDILQVTLNQYEAMQILDQSDLTGTIITSSQPVAVFSGNKNTYVGSNSNNIDMLVEQMIPAKAWGYTFALVPAPGNNVGEEIKVVAREPNTIIQVNPQKIKYTSDENLQKLSLIKRYC